MTTDFTPEAPHKDYECTLHVRGTKAWFQTIRDLLNNAEPRISSVTRWRKLSTGSIRTKGITNKQ